MSSFAMGIRRLAIVLWAVMAGWAIAAQGTEGDLRKQAEGYYANGHYAGALPFYQEGNAANARDPLTRYRYAHCLLECQQPESAIQILTTLTRDRKPNAQVFRLLGHACMDIMAYEEAMGYFKTFLRLTKEGEPGRQSVKDDIVRCAYALRMRTADEKAFVENAGPDINSVYDDFSVLNSPTIIDKIYFHSTRTSSGASLRLQDDTDIFTSSILNGRWSEPHRLPAQINSPGLEQACGFSADGQILFFARRTNSDWEMRADTFSGQDGRIRQGVSPMPRHAGEQPGDMFLFQDSICLFSAKGPDGFGGYDLYMAIRRQGVWQASVNLGPAINSPYDEQYPFLTRNGRRIYFSSNRPEGVGGFDVFQADFEDDQAAWRTPVNLGFPISSPGEDTWFVLAPDGMSGYLTSDRIHGLGGEDLYRVIFKQQILAHQQISAVPTFFHVLELAGRTAGSATVVAPVAEKKEYYLSHLFFDNGSEVLTPQNIKKLDVLVSLLQIYPKISVELSGFESTSGQRMYSLYFSVRQVDKAAAYLIQKGIAPSRILLHGYGTSFPILTASAASSSTALMQRLGQRIEITPLDFGDEPVDIHVERIQVPEQVKNPAYRIWQDTRSDLHYSVQIAATTQMLQNTDLESRDFVHIEYDREKNFHKYLTGWASTYREAEKERQAMQEIGFLQAFIVPYVDGRRLDSKRAVELAGRYPDLNNYLAGRQK